MIISPSDKFLGLEEVKLPPLSSGASDVLFPGVPLAVLPVGRERREGEGMTPRHGTQSDRGTVPVGGGSGRAWVSPVAPLSLPTEFPMTVPYSPGLGRPLALGGRRYRRRRTMLLTDKAAAGRAGPGWGWSGRAHQLIVYLFFFFSEASSKAFICESSVFLYADDVIH